MGWCSGTEIFDVAVGKVLKSQMTLGEKEDFVQALISILQDHDWDCESDSEYWKHPIVRRSFKKECPDWDWKDIESEEDDGNY